MNETLKKILQFVVIIISTIATLILFRINKIYGFVFPIIVIIIWFLISWIVNRRKKKSKEFLEYEDILTDFETAENKMRTQGSNANPYQILWEITKSKKSHPKIEKEAENYDRTNNGGNGQRDQGTPIREIPKFPERRSNISDAINSGDAINQSRDSRVKGNNRKGLFGRKRI